jgi:ABC-type sugar transport system substrate-binding protein
MRLEKKMLQAAVAALALTAATATLAKDLYRVAVIRWDPSDIYFNGVQMGQELERQRLEKAHGVKIEFHVFGANSVVQQRTEIETQFSRGIDGMLLVPWRGEAMHSAVTDLYRKGLPVVTSNALVPGAPQTFVAFDNRHAGRLGGQAIVRRLAELRGADWARKGGVIIELRCIITASFDIGRHEGYRSVFDPLVKANPNLKIETREARCDAGKARKAVDDLLLRYGAANVLAVASIDGTMGVGGAVQALEAQGLLHPVEDRRHIPVATVDGSLVELQAIARGHIDHVSVQPADGEGVLSMRLLFEMMRAGKPMARADKASTFMADSQELWAPVQVEPGVEFDGAWYRTKTFSVPSDVRYDDPRLWSIQMHKLENGGKAPDLIGGKFKD